MRRAVLVFAFSLLITGLLSSSCSQQPASPAATTPAAQPASLQPSSATFTVDELLKLRRVSDPQLSPDGKRVAFVLTEVSQEANTRLNHVWLVRLDGTQPVQLMSAQKSDDTPRWAPDGKRLAFVSAREGGSQVWTVDVDPAGVAGTPKKVTSLATEASGVRWSPDGKWLAFVSDVYPECQTNDCNAKALAAHEASRSKARVFDGLMFRHWNAWKGGRFSHLFLVPADASQPPRDVTPGAADVPPFSLGGPDDYAFSPDGKELAFAKKTDPVEAISTNSELFLLDLSTPNATSRPVTTNKGADAGPAYSPDGRYIAYRSQARPASESDRWRLMLYDRRTGESREAAPAFDTWVDAYAWTPDSKALYVGAELEGRSLAFRLDLPGTTPRALAIPGSVGDVQAAADGTIVFTKSTTTDPVEVFSANGDGTGAKALTSFNAAFMSHFKLKPAESVWYAGAAGARVQGWIVKPADFREDRKYPLLFLVHGGPQGAWHDSWGYRWNPQVFAAAGYVVFMPNPRGSTGFGQKFLDEISGDWGGKVFDDLMKGADYAEALPYVERGRTGAAGASYGGYMMDWFLGHTTRFKAIVTHAGVYNLASMYGVTEELWFPEWDLKGTPWTNPEMYDRLSPQRYAKNFKTPTLVTHGELDFRVPIGEGLQLYTTLQRLGVPSKMIYFPDEGHWINKPGNSALWYHSFIEWMDRWVKRDGKTTN